MVSVCCSSPVTDNRFTVESLLEVNEKTVAAITPYPGEQILLLKRIREHINVSDP